jgi:uncharacterized protein YjbI with pentapeptide repeats
MAPMFQRLFPAVEEDERPKAVRETPEAADEVSANAEAAGEGSSHSESSRLTETSAEQDRASQDCHPAESRDRLIDASELPPAGDVLAQLFADPPTVEARPATSIVTTEVVASNPESSTPASDAAPRKLGLLARLFRSKRALQQPAPAPPQASEALARVDTSSELAGVTPIEPQPEAAASPEVFSDSFVLAEIPEIRSAAASTAEASPHALQDAMPAEGLSPAAEGPDVLFSLDELVAESVEPSAQVEALASETLSREAEAIEVGTDEFDERSEEVSVEAVVSATSVAAAETNRAVGAQAAPATHASVNDAEDGAWGAKPPRGVTWPEGEAAISAEASHPTANSSERESVRTSASASVLRTPAGHEDHATSSSPQILESESQASEAEATGSTKPPSLVEPRRLYKDWAFDEKLASHAEWVESHGRTGQRADLSGAELEASDLISVNLRLADMHDANLRASDLLLADLRDACLVRADLEEACLVGANLEGANLEGASLETAMGLVPRQFAGANLRDALLAPHLMEFEAVTAFARESKNAFRYFWMMTAASVVSWLLIAKTRDVQLLTDSAIIPFLHSHAAAAALPTAESYLLVPVVIFVLYVLFHFHLQRLWDSVVELPAIFPDGHTLGDSGPAILSGLLRTHFRWMNPDPSSTRLVEMSASLAAAYWIVPMTLLLCWTRYLTRQEVHGTILQALLTTVAAGMATYGTLKVGRPQERWALENQWANRAIARIKAIHPVSVSITLGVFLLLLSAGVIFGVPHDRARAPQYGLTNIRRWAPDAFWWLAYDPYADLTEASISRRPAGWSGSDEEIASVDGLRANNAKFRYAQAYGAFFVNSHLFRADFQGAFLSEADLRGADLGQSNMRYATMDHAQMSHANLDRSNLDGADLRRADLRGSNLSYSSLENAVLVDAQMDQASLYTAKALGATLTRAVLEKADLREAYLVGAHMDHADLRNAYLWSARLPDADLGGAQLQNAIFIDADLTGANLGGAQMNGTVLNGVVLSGTSLEGADMRGALGLSASQVCSARSRRGLLLDPEMETQVEASCGKQ